jgi:predicted dehydrogenase
LQTTALGAAAWKLASTGPTASAAERPKIQGFEETPTDPKASGQWKPVSDRKIRMGIVGFGFCQFGSAFSLQDHPNVNVVAVSDLFPDRCAGLAKACRCAKTYPSLEELVKDDTIEAVFLATDAPSHARHCIDVLKHGKHVATAVPAVFGSLEDADKLFEAVKTSGLNYMMFETSCFHDDLYAMRQVYRSGGLGKLIYSEGEYFHYAPGHSPSYKDWRKYLPPQWYPTHSNAYYVCVTGGSFTDVSCLGFPGDAQRRQEASNNVYHNPFSTEIALLRTSEGGMARMGVSWATPGYGGEVGRIRGEKCAMGPGLSYEGKTQPLPHFNKPPLPPGVYPGGHGGSQGYLGNEFVMSILQKRKPLVNVAWALNMTVAGVVAHQSALKDGERLKIPQYTF